MIIYYYCQQQVGRSTYFKRRREFPELCHKREIEDGVAIVIFIKISNKGFIIIGEIF